MLFEFLSRIYKMNELSKTIVNHSYNMIFLEYLKVCKVPRVSINIKVNCYLIHLCSLSRSDNASSTKTRVACTVSLITQNLLYY